MTHAACALARWRGSNNLRRQTEARTSQVQKPRVPGADSKSRRAHMHVEHTNFGKIRVYCHMHPSGRLPSSRCTHYTGALFIWYCCVLILLDIYYKLLRLSCGQSMRTRLKFVEATLLTAARPWRQHPIGGCDSWSTTCGRRINSTITGPWGGTSSPRP